MKLIDKIKKWRHVFKLDPQRSLSDLALNAICASGTDAIIVGGTDGVTFENTMRLLQRLQSHDVFCVQEISRQNAVVPGFDGYLVPTVLNAGEKEWLIDKQVQAVKAFGDWIPWDHVLMEGYLSLNPQAKVTRLTKSNTQLEEDDCLAFARLSDRLFHLPIFYLEYSGVYGGVEMVKAARKGVKSARLFYGGGLSKKEQVKEIAAWADTLIVGNLVYINVQRAIQTVAWAKSVNHKQTSRREK